MVVAQDFQDRKTIFISHSRYDSSIAIYLKETLQNWTNYSIPIFQSSDFRNNYPSSFQDSKNELVQTLSHSDVVLPIYTDAELDWSFTMWECGIASNPSGLEARIIPFQIANYIPPALSDLLSVRLDRDSMRNFTMNFHKSPNFFPRFNDSITPHIDQQVIDRRSEDLLQGLSHLVPHATGVAQGSRWDYLTLRLDLEDIQRIQEASSMQQSAFQVAREIIPRKCVVEEVFGQADQHFGFAHGNSIGVPLGQLVERWQETSENGALGWFDKLYKEMTRAILNLSAEPSWELMTSSYYTRQGVTRWFAPIINHVRVSSREGWMEFDLYLYQIPDNIRAPSIEEVMNLAKSFREFKHQALLLRAETLELLEAFSQEDSLEAQGIFSGNAVQSRAVVRNYWISL